MNTTQNNAVPLRTRLKQRRDAQSPTDTSRGALLIRGRLFTWLASNVSKLESMGKPAPQHIAAFWALPGEPDLHALLRQWSEEEGYKISLPVVTKPEHALEFRSWQPDAAMTSGPYGIQEPVGDLAPLPDIILVPTLGYTRKGDRVGYGKGYYDRTLANLKEQGHRFTAIGIAWATGDLSEDDYTPAAHDIPLHAILTDKGWAVPAPELT